MGYLRLAEPAAAGNIVHSLLQERSANAEHDRAHATACWLQASLAAETPTALDELSMWADRIRSTARCKLSDPRR